MNAVVERVLASHNYSIPLTVDEAHPAYVEGYYGFMNAWNSGGYLKVMRLVNPYIGDVEADSFWEWQDGYNAAEQHAKWKEEAGNL